MDRVDDEGFTVFANLATSVNDNISASKPGSVDHNTSTVINNTVAESVIPKEEVSVSCAPAQPMLQIEVLPMMVVNHQGETFTNTKITTRRGTFGPTPLQKISVDVSKLIGIMESFLLVNPVPNMINRIYWKDRIARAIGTRQSGGSGIVTSSLFPMCELADRDYSTHKVLCSRPFNDSLPGTLTADQESYAMACTYYLTKTTFTHHNRTGVLSQNIISHPDYTRGNIEMLIKWHYAVQNKHCLDIAWIDIGDDVSIATTIIDIGNVPIELLQHYGGVVSRFMQ